MGCSELRWFSHGALRTAVPGSRAGWCLGGWERGSSMSTCEMKLFWEGFGMWPRGATPVPLEKIRWRGAVVLLTTEPFLFSSR